MPKIYWTEERIAEEALKHNTRGAFKVSASAAYQRASKLEILDYVCRHMKQTVKPNNYWTFERCMESAKKHRSISEWQKAKGDGSAYIAARKNGWIEQCTAHMVKKEAKKKHWHVLENCIESAKPFSSISAWENANGSAVNAARLNGWMELCTVHMQRLYKPKGFWGCLENCMASASNYGTITEWQNGEGAAYQAARVNGWLDQCTAHMPYNLPSDNDAIYLWKVLGEFRNGVQVYKVGVTSVKRGDQRIREVAKTHGFDFEIEILAKTIGKATDLEDQCLKLGTKLTDLEGDGATEFRALTELELRQVKKLMLWGTEEDLLAA